MIYINKVCETDDLACCCSAVPLWFRVLETLLTLSQAVSRDIKWYLVQQVSAYPGFTPLSWGV